MESPAGLQSTAYFDEMIRDVSGAVGTAGKVSRQVVAAIEHVDSTVDDMNAIRGEDLKTVEELNAETGRIQGDTASLLEDSQSSLDGSLNTTQETGNLLASVETNVVTAAEVSRFVEELEFCFAEIDQAPDGMKGVINRLHQFMARSTKGFGQFPV